jgi:hypothetical protein
VSPRRRVTAGPGPGCRAAGAVTVPAIMMPGPADPALGPRCDREVDGDRLTLAHICQSQQPHAVRCRPGNRDSRHHTNWSNPLKMYKSILFLAVLFLSCIQHSVLVQLAQIHPEKRSRLTALRSWRLLRTDICKIFLTPKLRGGQDEITADNFEEMPTFIPAPRLVGTKDCPPEEIVSIFRAPAIKKDIMVKHRLI